MVLAIPFLGQWPRRTTRTTSSFAFLSPRGGGMDNDTTTTSSSVETTSSTKKEAGFYTAVGVQIVGLDNDTIVKDERIMMTSLFQMDSNVILLQHDDDANTTHSILTPSSLLHDDTDNDNNNSIAAVWNGNNAAALQSLTTCCDVMVLVVVVDPPPSSTDNQSNNNNQNNTNNLLPKDVVQALAKGWYHREYIGKTSSLLIMLVSRTRRRNHPTHHHANTTSSDTTLAVCKDTLLTRDLDFLVTTTTTTTRPIVHKLHLVSLDDLEENNQGLMDAWKDILQHVASHAENTTSATIPVTSFHPWLQKTYNKTLEHDESTTDIANILPQQFSSAMDDAESTTDDSAQQYSQQQQQSTNHHDVVKDSALSDNGNDNDTLMTILTLAKAQIRDLELQQEELWLPATSDPYDHDSPIISPTEASLAFGIKVDRIIDDYQEAVANQQFVDDQSGTTTKMAQRGLWLYILPPLEKLYNQHLQYLREYCGKDYEAALERSTQDTSLDQAEYQKIWTDAAAQVTSLFREAAQTAIPTACRAGGALRDADFAYVFALEGLLSDMMQATETQQELLGMEPDDYDDDEDGSDRGMDKRKQKQPAKWYHKVAAKVFVFLVNYAQGWLAYQGIKRAAAERDAHLPKFPLF
jgi:hypothetical protein